VGNHGVFVSLELQLVGLGIDNDNGGHCAAILEAARVLHDFVDYVHRGEGLVCQAVDMHLFESVQ